MSSEPLQALLLSEACLLEQRGETRGQFNGLETGFRSLDAALQGLQPGSLTAVMGTGGVGKTAFALGILIHVGAVVKRPVLFFSLETSRQELAERILASTALIDSSKLRTGDLSKADWNRATEAYRYLQSAKVFIDDNPRVTTHDIRRSVTDAIENGDAPELLIIDNVQLVRPMQSRYGRYDDQSQVGDDLKRIAREFNVRILFTSQLSRDHLSRADRRPMYGDMRDSGVLEENSDVIISLFRAEMFGDVPDRMIGCAEVSLIKNRYGARRKSTLIWRDEFTRFDNRSSEQ